MKKISLSLCIVIGGSLNLQASANRATRRIANQVLHSCRPVKTSNPCINTGAAQEFASLRNALSGDATKRSSIGKLSIPDKIKGLMTGTRITLKDMTCNIKTPLLNKQQILTKHAQEKFKNAKDVYEKLRQQYTYSNLTTKLRDYVDLQAKRMAKQFENRAADFAPESDLSRDCLVEEFVEFDAQQVAQEIESLNFEIELYKIATINALRTARDLIQNKLTTIFEQLKNNPAKFLPESDIAIADVTREVIELETLERQSSQLIKEVEAQKAINVVLVDPQQINTKAEPLIDEAAQEAYRKACQAKWDRVFEGAGSFLNMIGESCAAKGRAEHAARQAEEIAWRAKLPKEQLIALEAEEAAQEAAEQAASKLYREQKAAADTAAQEEGFSSAFRKDMCLTETNGDKQAAIELDKAWDNLPSKEKATELKEFWSNKRLERILKNRDSATH